jgi:hypothetical protein
MGSSRRGRGICGEQRHGGVGHKERGRGVEGGDRGEVLADAARTKFPRECGCEGCRLHFADAVAPTTGAATVRFLSSFCRCSCLCRSRWRWSKDPRWQDWATE